MADPIKIDGLKQFLAHLKTVDAELPKTLRVAFNDAANVVISDARPRVPRRTGRAASSIKASSTRNKVRIKEGGARAPYMPWLDFGGRTGKKKTVKRPFLKDGRYVWSSFTQKRPELIEAITKALADSARAAGIEVE